MAFPASKIICPTSSKHEFTIILLHGRGSSSEEFIKEFLEGDCSDGKTLREHDFGNCKWVFPEAHIRSSTRFEEHRVWFDIWSLSTPDEQEELQIEGLRESVEYIHGIIDEELKHVPADHIILGGISMGFATAAHALLSGQHRLRGFFGFSGWLPLRSHLRKVASQEHETSLAQMYQQVLKMPNCNASKDALRTPVFVSHTHGDPTVEIENGYEARDIFKSLGMQVVFVESIAEDPKAEKHWIQEPQGYDAVKAQLESWTAQ